jgi:hypothetical protein
MSAKDVDDIDAKAGPTKPSRNRAGDDEMEAVGKSGRTSTGENKGGNADAKPKQRESAARAAAVNDGSGWFDAAPKKGRRNAPIVVDEPEEEEEKQEVQRSTKSKNKHGDDDDDIMVIPDMEEEGDGFQLSGDSRVAQAPRNVLRKIPTLAELENAVQATMPTVHEGGLDLAVLTATLVPAAGLEEKDEAWDFDGLLREVTDELTSTPKTVISSTISSSTVAALAKEKKALDKVDKSKSKPTKR